MIRQLGSSLFIFAFLVAFLAAQDNPRPDNPRRDNREPAKKKEIKKDEGKKKADEAPAPGDTEAAAKVKEIIDRLHKNFDASEDRLGKKDPGEDTRKIQDDIIKDLDELLKQQQNNQGGGGGASGAKGSKGGASGSAGNSGGSGGKGSKGGSQANNKGGAGGNQDKKGSAQLGKGGGKDGKGGNGAGGGDGKKEGKNTIADLFKDIWGHLPQTKRQEMDAYSKERFLPKYDEILRQYYRTISEQGRKDGE